MPRQRLSRTYERYIIPKNLFYCAKLGAIKEVFGDNIPLIGSTKSLSGHALGAAGVNESIYSLLMLQNDFVAESVNIENLDIEATGMPIVRETKDVKLSRILSNSFGQNYLKVFG